MGFKVMASPKPENLNPVQLPPRFWTMIDFGMMTLEEAKAEWAKQEEEARAANTKTHY